MVLDEWSHDFVIIMQYEVWIVCVHQCFVLLTDSIICNHIVHYQVECCWSTIRVKNEMNSAYVVLKNGASYMWS